MKKSVNLIIKSRNEIEVIRKIKLLFSLLTAAGLFFFVIVFIISFVYINNNLKQYTLLKKDIEVLENKITSQKTIEGIYYITAVKLSALEQILSQKKSFFPLIENIGGLQLEGVSIPSAELSTDGKVSFAVIASSSAQVNSLINLLLANEQKKLYSGIEARGFMKDKTGKYTMGVSLTADPSLLK